jgi:hypothetical protein
MTATQPVLNPLVDPAEVAYRNHERKVRRRQIVIIGVAASLAISFATWKVMKHLTAAWWLEANSFKVEWAATKVNWKLGGSTTVRYSPRSWFLAGQMPILNLKYLKDLHRLEELDVSTLSGMRDANFADLGDLTALRRLNLDRGPRSSSGYVESGELTDATLARIGRLTRLEELDLTGHRITDAGLEHLKGLDQLRSLDLEATEITDVGLERLKALPALTSLVLTKTKVTARGVAAFEASRPFVKVLSDTTPIVVPGSMNPP